MQKGQSYIRQRTQSLANGSVTVDISFDADSRQKLVAMASSDEDSLENQAQSIPVYSNGADVVGRIDIAIPDRIATVDYEEISVFLVGHVIADEHGHDDVFLSHKMTIKAGPGSLSEDSSFEFRFHAPAMELDSYYGSLFQCRYFVRALVRRSGTLFGSNIKRDHDFYVLNPRKMGRRQSVALQVGVEECLHIRFEYFDCNIPLGGCLEGKVTVLSNHLKILSMRIQLIRREMVRTAVHRPEILSTAVLGEYEVMDGLPGDGEVIPIRMFLQRFKGVTNTQIRANHSVRYFANLGLIDADGRRYFKNCEIFIVRTKLD